MDQTIFAKVNITHNGQRYLQGEVVPTATAKHIKAEPHAFTAQDPKASPEPATQEAAPNADPSVAVLTQQLNDARSQISALLESSADMATLAGESMGRVVGLGEAILELPDLPDFDLSQLLRNVRLSADVAVAISVLDPDNLKHMNAEGMVNPDAVSVLLGRDVSAEEVAAALADLSGPGLASVAGSAADLV